MAAPTSNNQPHKFTNALIHEKSPYLLQHAHNPVHWYPWNEEALTKAKPEDKLIFLSVGYSTCHWCHVMERESFENEDVAKLLNEHFVCIKVDREERPDIDKIYMNYVTAITQRGGWPMSVWLTPSDLHPVYGGTFYRKPDFVNLLNRLNHLWHSDPHALTEQSKKVMDALTNAMIKQKVEQKVPDVDKIYAQTFEKFVSRYDKTLGGFGSAPKFPRPVEIDFLLRFYNRNKHTAQGQQALNMSTKTLQAMANGGMYDHLAGGFHRYSVDEYFHVPHFEKMLYDNAQLIVTYLNAFQITKDESYKQVAIETLNYILQDMRMDKGGVYSAEDADSLNPDNMKEKKEGAFYIWKEQEFDTLLTKDESMILKQLYFIQERGNTVLSHKSDPHRDDKIICGWNGLILSSFATAHKVLNLAETQKDKKNDIYVQSAKEIAQFIYDHMRDAKTGYLYRIFGKTTDIIYGFSIDYSFLIRGLLDLYQCCFEPKWLKWAMELQDIQNELFFDDELGGYFDTVKDSKHLIMRLKEEYDGAEPCSSSIAVSNLLVLYHLTKNEDYLKRYAKKTLQYLHSTLERMPFAIPAAVIALEAYQNGLKQVVISSVEHPDCVGEHLDDEKDEQLKQEQINEFLRVLYGNFYPDAVCCVLNNDNCHAMKDEINEMYQFYSMDKNNRVMASVCQLACLKPTNDLT
eukprot:1109071_1